MESPDWYHDAIAQTSAAAEMFLENNDELSHADLSLIMSILEHHYKSYDDMLTRPNHIPLTCDLVRDVLEVRAKYDGDNPLPWFETYLSVSTLDDIYHQQQMESTGVSDNRGEPWEEDPEHAPTDAFSPETPAEKELMTALSGLVDVLDEHADLEDEDEMFYKK